MTRGQEQSLYEQCDCGDCLLCAYHTAVRERDELRAQVERLISANDTLVTRIEDLTEGFGLEDTCPRVQCRTTSRRLKAEIMQLRTRNAPGAPPAPNRVTKSERLDGSHG